MQVFIFDLRGYKRWIGLLFISWVLLNCHSQRNLVRNSSATSDSATRLLPATLAKIPVGMETAYGFKSRDEFTFANAGEPFRFVTWAKDSFRENEVEYSLPILVAGEMRAIATMAKMTDTFEIVDFGAAGLAGEIQNWKNDHKDFVFLGILRKYSIACDFIMAKNVKSDKTQQVYFPLKSTQKYMKSKSIPVKTYYPEIEVILFLKTNS